MARYSLAFAYRTFYPDGRSADFLMHQEVEAESRQDAMSRAETLLAATDELERDGTHRAVVCGMLSALPIK